MSSSTNKRPWVYFALGVLVGVLLMVPMMRGKSELRPQEVAPTEVATSSGKSNSGMVLGHDAATGDDIGDNTVATGDPITRPSSIKDVLALATEARKAMETSLSDYTARFVKQERGEDRQLGEKSEISLKIQTRLRNDSNDAPMRIYLRFASPKSNAGREVIWGQDIYDGQMAVHETSMLLSWKTLWLDPTGIIAMTGQKYPVYEIGLVKLVEKLLERGRADLGNPDVSVTITRDHEFDTANCELIRVTRTTPGDGEDDFSLAEIIYDPERLLILSYRSFGWPEDGNGDTETPLLESYEYRDLKVNVGLTKKDFDVTNSEYGYP